MKPGSRSSERAVRSAASSAFRLGEFDLDLTRGTLRVADAGAALRPKALEVPIYLVRNAGRVVGKSELLDEIWSDVIVTEDSLSQCIHEVRRALNDNAHEVVRTVARRGYVISAQLASVATPEGRAPPAGDDAPTGAGLDGPRIAVLPFAFPSDMAEGENFADGFGEDVILGLCHVRRLFVISHLSSVAYQAGSGRSEFAAGELSVRYLVGGSIRSTDNRLRIIVQLTDEATGTVL